jgi:hypothetical protein
MGLVARAAAAVADRHVDYGQPRAGAHIAVALATQAPLVGHQQPRSPATVRLVAVGAAPLGRGMDHGHGLSGRVAVTPDAEITAPGLEQGRQGRLVAPMAARAGARRGMGVR